MESSEDLKLFYKKNGSSGSSTQITINSKSTLTKVVAGLDEYTDYEFEVLAFTSVGDGPKSSVESERTMEDGKKIVHLSKWREQMWLAWKNIY